MWYGNASNQDCKALQRVVHLAERISGSALPSLQDIYLKRCKSRAAKIIKDLNHPGNHLFCLLPSGKRFRSMMAKTERLRRSFFPQAIRLTRLNLINCKTFIILHHPYCCYVYIPGTTCLHILLAHPFILLFIKSTVYCIAHFTPYFFFLFLFYFDLYLYILYCVMFNFLHGPLSGPDLIYTSLLIIFCIVEYVTNKTNLEPLVQYKFTFQLKHVT